MTVTMLKTTKRPPRFLRPRRTVVFWFSIISSLSGVAAQLAYNQSHHRANAMSFLVLVIFATTGYAGGFLIGGLARAWWLHPTRTTTRAKHDFEYGEGGGGFALFFAIMTSFTVSSNYNATHHPPGGVGNVLGLASFVAICALAKPVYDCVVYFVNGPFNAWVLRRLDKTHPPSEP